MDNISLEEFLAAAKEFAKASDNLRDGWRFIENEDLCKCYLKKEFFVTQECMPLKAAFIVFFSLSYGVPQFSFNVWNSSGMLLTLEELQTISFIKYPNQSPNDKSIYSVITQQEHPILNRPYFIVHPCHTGETLACFKAASKNILVTFLGMIQTIIKLDLTMEYGNIHKGPKSS